jgi:hypothetical protein
MRQVKYVGCTGEMRNTYKHLAVRDRLESPGVGGSIILNSS